MPAPKGDPTYIKNKERYFMGVAKAVGLRHRIPLALAAVLLSVIERSWVTAEASRDSKIEIDPVCYAIAAACKRGTPMTGAVIYTTRYPFSASVFQAHIMGIRKIAVLAHEWEPYYKDEFRRAARLARELNIAIEPFFEDEDPRLSVNSYAEREVDDTLYHDNNDHTPDDYDPQNLTEIQNDN